MFFELDVIPKILTSTLIKCHGKSWGQACAVHEWNKSKSGSFFRAFSTRCGRCHLGTPASNSLVGVRQSAPRRAQSITARNAPYRMPNRPNHVINSPVLIDQLDSLFSTVMRPAVIHNNIEALCNNKQTHSHLLSLSQQLRRRKLELEPMGYTFAESPRFKVIFLGPFYSHTGLARRLQRTSSH